MQLAVRPCYLWVYAKLNNPNPTSMYLHAVPNKDNTTFLTMLKPSTALSKQEVNMGGAATGNYAWPQCHQNKESDVCYFVTDYKIHSDQLVITTYYLGDEIITTMHARLGFYLNYERLVIKSLWEKCVMRRSTSRLIIIVDPQSLYLHYFDLRHLNAKQHFQAS